MEKSTQKFLSILLSIAILFCFPIVSQASEDVYHETFKGTYTAPESTRNVLVSGNDASVSEWYGDRVNVGGHTYSVRQNEYGLNKDGNMIKMETNKTYTVWLAQYGVASFSFTAPSDGKYVFSTSENETYAPYYNGIHSLYNDQYGLFRPRLSLVDSKDNKEHAYNSGAYYYHQNTDADSDLYNDAVIHYDLDAGQTVYIAALNNYKPITDLVYDVSVTKWSPEKCRHTEFEEVTRKRLEGCKYEQTYKCTICNNTFTEIEEQHDYSRHITHHAVNCLDSTTGMRICDDCGKAEPFTWENYGPHKEASRKVDYIGYWGTDYICTCSLCGEEYWDYEDSPCYNAEKDEVYHSFGNRDNIPCGKTVTCTKCGYEYTAGHDYEFSYSENTPLTNDGTCYKHTSIYTCTKCGATDSDSWDYHAAYEYVQVTPQHDNVCGTYNYVCTGCGAKEYDTPLTCHSYGADGICRRCGDKKPCNHYYGNGVYFAPTCTESGGTRYTCEYCKNTKIENPVPATGHNFGNNNRTCLTCGAVNPNYVAPQPTQPSNPQPSVPVQPSVTDPVANETEKAPKGAKKVNGEWVAKKQKNTKVSKLTKAKKSFKTSWKKVNGVTGYQIQYSTSKKFTKKTTKTVTVKGTKKTSATVKKLKSKKKYYVRIRTYKNTKLNGKTVKVYSTWSKTKTVKTK